MSDLLTSLTLARADVDRAAERRSDPAWLDEVLAQLPERFDRSCDRWRQLYRAAMAQREREHKRENDNSISPRHKAEAKRFRQEAENQRDLLLNHGQLYETLRGGA